MDFIIVDYSNNNIQSPQLDGPLSMLLDLYAQRLAKNVPTPKVTFLIPGDEGQISTLWNKYYAKYPAGIFFHYQGKPLLMPMNACGGICSQFTIRPTWALGAAGKWSFMDVYPQPIYYHDGAPEQMAVSAAQQVAYMSDDSAHARNYDFRTGKNSGHEGLNFEDQWGRAIASKVNVVVIKSWNEWCSMNVDGQGHFTDELNPNQSNDIEPVQGGFGHSYYDLMKQEIALFKKSQSDTAHESDTSAYL